MLNCPVRFGSRQFRNFLMEYDDMIWYDMMPMWLDPDELLRPIMSYIIIALLSGVGLVACAWIPIPNK